MNNLLTKQEYEIVTWCWKNQIYVHPKPIQGSGKHWATPDVKLEVRRGVKRRVSDKVYKQDTRSQREKLREKIFELYKYYYDSLN